ncbi:hypothetical protein [Leisingera sp. ANG59]|uniref:hypothetical protein n=1 Tax=Leisingera sp. ANG59 TaxID=2675221 RepID=UPI0015722FE6|nr:hypothetical protein [Leisingera sp. ANG59]NSY39300.1 hypothetical protein [Leisingera sp. ANG59]
MPCNAPVSVHCGKCGGQNIKADATAVWVNEIQDWELSAVFDSCVCEDCGQEVKTYEFPIIEPSAELEKDLEQAVTNEAAE